MNLRAGGPITWAAERFADRTAVICEQRTLSDRQLNDDVNRLAHALLTLGLQPGDRVEPCSPIATAFSSRSSPCRRLAWCQSTLIRAMLPGSRRSF